MTRTSQNRRVRIVSARSFLVQFSVPKPSTPSRRTIFCSRLISRQSRRVLVGPETCCNALRPISDGSLRPTYTLWNIVTILSKRLTIKHNPPEYGLTRHYSISRIFGRGGRKFGRISNGVSHCSAGREQKAILQAVELPSILFWLLEFVDIPPGGEDI